MSTTTLSKPWENGNGASPSTPATSGTEPLVSRSPTTGNMGNSSFPDISTPTTTGPTTTGTVATLVPQTPTGTSSSQQVTSMNNATDMSNQYASSYGSGMGYGGLGSSYGGLGMGSMYGGLGMGGLGMGGMYGGLGMGGMYGGLGMGGMYGGLGMGGMYGMGMTEDFQRSQMTFMLVGRLLEMCGMFAGVIQMTFGSALQFMGNYIGMSQQYNQLKSGMYKDENGQWVQVPKRISNKETGLQPSHGRRATKRKQQGRGWLFPILRRLAFLILAVFLAKKLTGWWAVRQLSKHHGP